MAKWYIDYWIWEQRNTWCSLGCENIQNLTAPKARLKTVSIADKLSINCMKGQEIHMPDVET